MWTKQIVKYKSTNPYIRINEPSNEKEIAVAEKELGVPFPIELKELLLELNGDSYLLYSVQQIVENTIMTRRALGEYYEGLNELLFIGGNGCGDQYSYIIANGVIAANGIVRWEHEDNSRTLVASSLAELIEKYYTDQA